MSGHPLPARLHAEALLALTTALLFSIPFAKYLVTSLKRRPPKQSENVYEDRDGQSTPGDVLEFSTRGPRTVVALFAATGCSASIYLAVLETRASRFSADVWLYSAAWVCVFWAAGPPLLTTRNRLFSASTRFVWRPAGTRSAPMIWGYGYPPRPRSSSSRSLI